MNESCKHYRYLQKTVSSVPAEVWAMAYSDLMAMTLKLKVTSVQK